MTLNKNLKNHLQSSNFNLFPTLVIQYANVISELERENIFNTLKKRSTNSHTSIIEGTSSYNMSENKDLVNIFALEERLQERLDNYTQETGIFDQKICQSWFNIQNVGSQLLEHCHSGATLSCALYINVNGLQDSLCFQNPNPMLESAWISHVQSLTQYNFKYTSFTPKNGDLFIFPSWLTHGSYYQSNQTPDRMVISFNTIDNRKDKEYN